MGPGAEIIEREVALPRGPALDHVDGAREAYYGRLFGDLERQAPGRQVRGREVIDELAHGLTVADRLARQVDRERDAAWFLSVAVVRELLHGEVCNPAVDRGQQWVSLGGVDPRTG